MRVTRFTLAFLLVASCGRHGLVPAPEHSRPLLGTRSAAPAKTADQPSTAPRAEPALEREQLREPPPPALRELPHRLPELGGSPPPAYCARLTSGPLRAPRRACGDSTWARLASALEISGPEVRDRALAQLEDCNELPEGWLRAVRADFARACADMLVVPVLRTLQAPLDADLGETLLGLSLAARWGRAIEKLTPFVGSAVDDSLEPYLAKTLRPWKLRQLARLQALSVADALLERDGYGATILAIARALAAHELYSVVRSSPIATELKKDYVRRTSYYGAIERELEDIRLRISSEDARVAELVFEQGIHRAPDADQWFGLQRADLSNLVIEPPPEVEPSSDRERLARRLPAFYFETLFGAAALDDPRLLRLMIEPGLTPRQRRALGSRRLDARMNETLAYFQASLAIRTRRLGEFDEVVARLEPVETRSPAGELLLATARSACTGRAMPDPQTGEERGWVFDPTPLLALAEARGPERERAFALNNAAWLSIVANTPESSRSAGELASRARALAPDEACLRPLYDGFIFERSRPPCGLPRLP